MANKKEQSPALTVARMPMAEDPAIRAAKLRAQEARTRSSGRMSTILTDSLRDMIGSHGMLGA